VTGDARREAIHAAIGALWADPPDVAAWNTFWFRTCLGLRGWKLPEDMDLNLPLALGTSIAGRDWTGVNFSNGSLTGKNFSNHVLDGAQLYHADLRGCMFVGARLRNANLEAANLAGADLRGADLTGANLKGARLKGTILTGAILDRADLRFAQDIRFDENPVEGARFSSRFGIWRPELPEAYSDWAERIGSFDDRWSKLRRTYTGPRFALLLLLTLAFLVPRVLKTTALVVLGETEAGVMAMLERERARTRAPAVPDAAVAPLGAIIDRADAAARDALDAFEARWREALAARRAAAWDDVRDDILRGKERIVQSLHARVEQSKREAERWLADQLARSRTAALEAIRAEYDARPRFRVWEVLLDLDRGRYHAVVLAVVLLVFNALRLLVTLMVGSLREAEERSHITPAAAEYALAYRLHLVTSALWIVAVADLAIAAYRWLNTPVVLF
jgi:hypothetical protein